MPNRNARRAMPVGVSRHKAVQCLLDLDACLMSKVLATPACCPIGTPGRPEGIAVAAMAGD